jgi:hypothetical protein
MAKSQVRRIIIAEWLSLSPDKRKTKQQAATFALKAAHRHIRVSGRPVQGNNGMAVLAYRQN